MQKDETVEGCASFSVYKLFRITDPEKNTSVGLSQLQQQDETPKAFSHFARGTL